MSFLGINLQWISEMALLHELEIVAMLDVWGENKKRLHWTAIDISKWNTRNRCEKWPVHQYTLNNTKEANGHGMIVSEIGQQRNFLRKIQPRNKSINLAIIKDQWHSNIRNVNKNVQCKKVILRYIIIKFIPISW